MKLIQRIGYYMGGFSMGLIILAFFLSGKHVSCDYGPQARVLKSISTKKILFSRNVMEAIEEDLVDSITIRTLLKEGPINFSKSQPREKPCGIYAIEGHYNNKEILVSVYNCDSIATVSSVTLPKNKE